MKIDDYDFENTARVVFLINPRARRGYRDWEELRDSMISIAYLYCYKSNSFSTGGYLLTGYDGSDGERHVRASVTAFTVMEYLKEQAVFA
jgi:hypothetical protein